MKKNKLGDLLYDNEKSMFGLVAEQVDNPTFPWIVHWNDGTKNWVDDKTVNIWKRYVQHIRKTCKR